MEQKEERQKAGRGYGIKGEIETFFFLREDIKEFLYATGSEKLQRKTHVSERENLPEQGP